MRNLLKSFLNDEQGATSIEYAYIAMMIGIGIIISLKSIAPAFNNKMDDVSTNLSAT